MSAQTPKHAFKEFDWLEQVDPVYDRARRELATLVWTPEHPSLEIKYREIIAAVILGCRGYPTIDAHIRRAVAEGASLREVVEGFQTATVPGGFPVLHFALPMKTPGVSVMSNWHTLGMRGTGSNDYAVENLFVPDHMTVPVAPLSTPAPGFEGPLYRMWPLAFGVLNEAIVSVGVAQTAIDEAVRLCKSKTPAYNMTPLREQQLAQLLRIDVLHCRPACEGEVRGVARGVAEHHVDGLHPQRAVGDVRGRAAHRHEQILHVRRHEAPIRDVVVVKRDVTRVLGHEAALLAARSGDLPRLLVLPQRQQEGLPPAHLQRRVVDDRPDLARLPAVATHHPASRIPNGQKYADWTRALARLEGVSGTGRSRGS